MLDAFVLGVLLATSPSKEDDDTPFAGRTSVTVEELTDELESMVDGISRAKAVRDDFRAFAAAHDLDRGDDLYRDYVRVKIAFEATRDGGLWGLRWRITNRKPNSEAIWKQWADLGDVQAPTATAECDELSALFAFIARRMGVQDIGLFWPVWNHVVAVWTVEGERGKPVRIVVPTSQIFLSADESLGTRGFNPRKQRTIYEYRRKDVPGSFAVPGELARFARRVSSVGACLRPHHGRGPRAVGLCVGGGWGTIRASG